MAGRWSFWSGCRSLQVALRKARGKGSPDDQPPSGVEVEITVPVLVNTCPVEFGSELLVYKKEQPPPPAKRDAPISQAQLMKKACKGVR